MKVSSLLFVLLASAATAAAQESPTGASPKAAPDGAVPQILNEHDQRVQQFMAERAKLIEARQAVQEKTKQAKTKKDNAALRTAQTEAKQLETEFLSRNAALLQQLQADAAAKKPVLPAGAKARP